MLGLSNFVCVCNDGVLPVTLNLLVEAQAPISRAAALSSVLYPPVVFPFNEPRRALGCLVQESAPVEQEDVVARAGLRSVSGRDDGGLRSLRVT